MKKEMKEKKYIFFFKQKTAYEMRISDWSSDACSSDLIVRQIGAAHRVRRQAGRRVGYPQLFDPRVAAMTVVRVGFGHAAPVAFNRIDDARHSHAAAMRQHLLFLPANEQGEIDRLRPEQRRRDGQDELADQAFRTQAQRHDAGPSRLTSHASV